MATIPVQKKSNINWLWLVILFVVIALFAWWLLADNNNNTTANVENSAYSETALVVGNSVDISNATVTELTGDMSFKIDYNGKTALVVFNEQATPYKSIEGNYDINVGQTISLDGVVKSTSDNLPDNVDAPLIAEVDTYIFANTLNIDSRS